MLYVKAILSKPVVSGWDLILDHPMLFAM